MADVVAPTTRSRMMAGIRAKNTAPELMIRRGLHNRGFRYRLHAPKLPGKPDLVFPRHRAVIFIHGCFWHAHECCLFKWPTTRVEFWKEKLMRNRESDHRNCDRLLANGWRVLTVWECSLKGPGRISPETLLDKVVEWLLSDVARGELRGK
jgi:DNA mismatch endonuclease (patch repair protein)